MIQPIAATLGLVAIATAAVLVACLAGALLGASLEL